MKKWKLWKINIKTCMRNLTEMRIIIHLYWTNGKKFGWIDKISWRTGSWRLRHLFISTNAPSSRISYELLSAQTNNWKQSSSSYLEVIHRRLQTCFRYPFATLTKDGAASRNVCNNWICSYLNPNPNPKVKWGVILGFSQIYQ